MSRRITFTIVDDNINSEKAIQPKEDDLALKLLAAVMAHLEQLDHEGMTVVHVSATKEELAEQTDASKADHPNTRVSSYEQYPQKTADEGAAVGNEATWPGKSDHRLVELIRLVLNSLYILFFSCFLKELFKKFGGEVGKLLGKITFWILVCLFMWWMFGFPFPVTVR